MELELELDLTLGVRSRVSIHLLFYFHLKKEKRKKTLLALCIKLVEQWMRTYLTYQLALQYAHQFLSVQLQFSCNKNRRNESWYLWRQVLKLTKNLEGSYLFSLATQIPFPVLRWQENSKGEEPTHFSVFSFEGSSACSLNIVVLQVSFLQSLPFSWKMVILMAFYTSYIVLTLGVEGRPFLGWSNGCGFFKVEKTINYVYHSQIRILP